MRTTREQKVVTWGAPGGGKLNITPRQEARLRALCRWPKDHRGVEYCQVVHGLHYDWSATDEEVGL